MEFVLDPEEAEWLGCNETLEEEELSSLPSLPAGFLQATYCAGERPRIVLQLDPPELPLEWTVVTEEHPERPLMTSAMWKLSGQACAIECEWVSEHLPKLLRVQWDDGEAFWPVNADDTQRLPAPPQLHEMSADEMLWILASADPGAALRAWTQRERDVVSGDDELDAAIPLDLDPLKRHDLSATFLHRTRRRARVLATGVHDLNGQRGRCRLWNGGCTDFWASLRLLGKWSASTRRLRISIGTKLFFQSPIS